MREDKISRFFSLPRTLLDRWLRTNSETRSIQPLESEDIRKSKSQEIKYTQPLSSNRRTLSTDASVYVQNTSIFFMKLPAELRHQIYADVFGSNIIHLIWIPGRICHVRCTPSISYQNEKSCMCTNNMDPTYRLWEPPEPGDASKIDFDLLFTCKQAYMEGIDLLYSLQTFDFFQPSLFMQFSSTVLPQRLSCITSMRITWLSPEAPRRREGEDGIVDGFPESAVLPVWWDPMWDIVTNQMPKLKNLEVNLENNLQSPSRSLSWEEEELLLQSLKDIRGLKKFDLYIKRNPWTGTVSYGEGPMSPFAWKLKDAIIRPR
ncbi:hypothetical protein M501DRAFT_1030584 [Patellaria atrata CBS 101060]|uniref:DUF7730 domain-containing protein n=1 Tax=Patellaria atrata CBS 101060 TaxID=1346257 RepID=A0A9P4VSE2_9PEZI|nr:hypothetical protein M501DRAFT_1030584 [Patellaria atrata CBS 101060]